MARVRVKRSNSLSPAPQRIARCSEARSSENRASLSRIAARLCRHMSTVRLMLAGFLIGVVHDRRLMREAQVNIAILWFVGYGLYEALPDHSSLTRIRQRWGVERFRRIFERTVQACIDAKIAKGEVVHVDASLIRADVSWDSLAVRHVEAVTEANEDAQAAQRKSRKTGKFKKVCVIDWTRAWRQMPEIAVWSRPTSSMPLSMTCAGWFSVLP